MFYARAFQVFRNERAALATAALLVFANAAAGVVKPWPLALIVDSVLGSTPFPAWLGRFAGGWNRAESITALALLSFALHGLQSLLQYGQQALVIRSGLRGLASTRQSLFETLLRRSMRSHQRSSLGDLIYRASWDVYAFQTFLQKGVFGALAACSALGGMIWVMARLNLGLTATTLAVAPILVLMMRHFGPGMTRLSDAAHRADSGITSMIQQRLSALLVIQAYGQEDREAASFSDRVSSSFQARLAQHRYELRYLVLIGFGFGVGLASILWVGAIQVSQGALTIGGWLVFLAYANQLFEPLSQLSHIGASLSDARAGMARVFDLLDAPDEGRPDTSRGRSIQIVRTATTATAQTALSEKGYSPSTEPIDRLRQGPSVGPGRIEFDSVCFAYGNAVPVLKEFSAVIKPGATVAVIGPSGSGKTTLLHLLYRFWDPVGGRILVDGVDLQEVRVKEWRRALAYVPQETILFPGTIRDNIAYGRGVAAPKEIEEAARAAFADGFIRRLPQGYDTFLGDGGARLSTGEMQRLNLARAYLKDAPIVLLDEPTSALDQESEQLVIQSLCQHAANRTVVFVTHRECMLSIASQIIRLG